MPPHPVSVSVETRNFWSSPDDDSATIVSVSGNLEGWTAVHQINAFLPFFGGVDDPRGLYVHPRWLMFADQADRALWERVFGNQIAGDEYMNLFSGWSGVKDCRLGLFGQPHGEVSGISDLLLSTLEWQCWASMLIPHSLGLGWVVVIYDPYPRDWTSGRLEELLGKRQFDWLKLVATFGLVHEVWLHRNHQTPEDSSSVVLSMGWIRKQVVEGSRKFQGPDDARVRDCVAFHRWVAS